MCTILDQPPTNFIGFSLWYPFTDTGHVRYTSGTCNPYWFNGSRGVSVNCDGTNWQSLIYNTLFQWLPH